MFAIVFGFFFWNAVGYFIYMGIESQMRGEMFPMNVNEQIIRPMLSNASVIGLFFIPMITMRLFAEEKRTGTIEQITRHLATFQQRGVAHSGDVSGNKSDRSRR